MGGKCLFNNSGINAREKGENHEQKDDGKYCCPASPELLLCLYWGEAGAARQHGKVYLPPPEDPAGGSAAQNQVGEGGAGRLPLLRTGAGLYLAAEETVL